MAKKSMKFDGGRLFVGTNRCDSRYNIIQREDHFDLIFEENGVFKASNSYALLSMYAEAYEITPGEKESTVLVQEQANTNILRVFGKQIHCVGEFGPNVFSLSTPRFESLISKTNALFEPQIDQVIEIFLYDDFKAIVYRNYTDATLPDYNQMTKAFGYRLNHMGKPCVAFRCTEGTPSSELFLGKGFMTYTASNGDVIAMMQKDETRVSANINLPEYEEVNNFGEGELATVLKTLVNLNNKLEHVITMNSSLSAENKSLRKQILDIEAKITDYEYNHKTSSNDDCNSDEEIIKSL